MGKEANNRPTYEILAIVTMNKDGILGGSQLSLLAKDKDEQKTLAIDIAKAMKADVVQLANGDYLILRV
ncbi:MAG: capping complex subunit for YIEGIA [Bacillaceae bacterium]